MKIYDLPTPVFLVDLDILERNIREAAELARDYGKRLWPMVKTHKSTEIAEMQKAAGAEGFLVGTLLEAERLVEKGFTDIMLAYPVAGRENLKRVVRLAQKARIILSIDCVEVAREITSALEENGIQLEYLMIIDSGLRRFGVLPEDAVGLARDLAAFQALKLAGIATHPGHVYGASESEEVDEIARQEAGALKTAAGILEKEGFKVEIVAAGSTPTFRHAVKDERINVLRPGNYVFYDCIQAALGVAPLEKCSFTVMGTVISKPRPKNLIIDVGSKCLGLDRGAHGISLVKGFGAVAGHPELTLVSLSEEVAKVEVEGETSLRVGDRVRIIPNHACAACNMTSYLVGCRGEEVEKIIEVDMRNGTWKPEVFI
ncbi:alanine racemase [Thermosediminibacter litoriperuensis]|uniref:D-serine deaminase-like pyridoxal phosphate-dependent protein n=1 Tax=Thermosediminibacter litoriperuensis TaxID=291989 RepID=A0A5S5ARP6_9FIRM|nr:alanine racemase [Thermosediminibacter litoriperuensis]TYP53282.1 D-serine deaminase-like pyridoxal phosphate-dependent protein [Thermosediminibacter litoriperuensis]